MGKRADAEAEAEFHKAIGEARRKYADTLRPFVQEAEKVLQAETDEALRVFKVRVAAIESERAEGVGRE